MENKKCSKPPTKYILAWYGFVGMEPRLLELGFSHVIFHRYITGIHDASLCQVASWKIMARLFTAMLSYRQCPKMVIHQ